MSPGGLPVVPLVRHAGATRSSSLPQLNPQRRVQSDNLSRPGHVASRAESLQRQFEHAGAGQMLTRPARARVLGHLGSGYDDDAAARHASPITKHCMRATVLSAASATTEDEWASGRGSFGSQANMRELKLAEVSVKRHGALDAASLDSASRGVAEESLAGLRRACESASPALAPMLARIADALEPCLFSEERDDQGRRMTHEQVSLLLLAPKLQDAIDRAERASLRLAELQGEMRAQAKRITALEKELEETEPQLRSLEARKTGLELQLSSARREVAELVEENGELVRAAEGTVDVRMRQLEGDIALLRETNAALSHQGGRLSQALQESVPIAEALDLRSSLAAAERARDAESTRALTAEMELSRSRSRCDELDDECTRLADELREHRATASPRPDWDRLQRRAKGEARTLESLVPGEPRLLSVMSAPFSSIAAGPATGSAAGPTAGPAAAAGKDDASGCSSLLSSLRVRVEAVDAATAANAHPAGTGAGGSTVLSLGLRLPAPSSAASASSVVNQMLEAWHEIAELRYRTPNEAPTFEALGDGPEVPVFLRLPGHATQGRRLRNHRMAKRDVELLVRDFWAFYYLQRAGAADGARIVAGKAAVMRRRPSVTAAAAGGGAWGSAHGLARGPSDDALTATSRGTSPPPETQQSESGAEGHTPDTADASEQSGSSKASLSLSPTARRSSLASSPRRHSLGPSPSPGRPPPPPPPPPTVAHMFDAFLMQRVAALQALRPTAQPSPTGTSSGSGSGVATDPSVASNLVGAAESTSPSPLTDPSPDKPLLQRVEAVELALNVLDGCRRYVYDADLELFLDVLSRRVPPDAHAAQMRLVEQLRDAFAVADRQQHDGLANGTVRRAAVPMIVRSVFPTRSDADYQALLAALDRDVPGGPEGTVQYAELFREDADLNESAFVERARAQGLRAPREYVSQIGDALRQADVRGTGLVTMQMAMDAIKTVDPQIAEAQLRAMVTLGLKGDGTTRSSQLSGGTAKGGTLTTQHLGEEVGVDDEDAGERPTLQPLNEMSVDERVFCRRLLFSYPRRHGPPPKPLPSEASFRKPRRGSVSSGVKASAAPGEQKAAARVRR